MTQCVTAERRQKNFRIGILFKNFVVAIKSWGNTYEQLKSSYEVNYLHRIYSKLAWLVFSFTITTLIDILFVKHASINFTFIAAVAVMMIRLAIAYTFHMFLLTRNKV